MCTVNWNSLCSQTVGIGRCNVGIKKFSHVLLSLSPCVCCVIHKYSLGVLALFNITGGPPPQMSLIRTRVINLKHQGSKILTIPQSDRTLGHVTWTLPYFDNGRSYILFKFCTV